VIGDWIVLSDGVEGRVVESTWRSTHVLTGSNNVVVLPNSFLARLGLTNVSRPDGTHLLTLTVRIAPTRMPSVVVEVMQSVLLSCSSTISEPAPTVALKGLDAVALEVELQFRVASPAQRTQARSEVLDLVYRHRKSAGLLLAMPRESVVAMTELPTKESARPPRVESSGVIDAIPVFTTLTRNERLSLDEATSTREFRKGDVIARQGDVLPALMMIRAGVISCAVTARRPAGWRPAIFWRDRAACRDGRGLHARGADPCDGLRDRPARFRPTESPGHGGRPEDLALSLSRRSPPVIATERQGLRQERCAHVFRKAIQRIFHDRPNHDLSAGLLTR
jgi:hypothetical protein